MNKTNRFSAKVLAVVLTLMLSACFIGAGLYVLPAVAHADSFAREIRKTPLNLTTTDYQSETGVYKYGNSYENTLQGWAYDPTTYTLTLTDIDFQIETVTAATDHAAIFLPKIAKVILKGDNKIVVPDQNIIYRVKAISFYFDVGYDTYPAASISGGKLAVELDGDVCAIWAGKGALSISKSNLNLKVHGKDGPEGSNSGSADGIYAISGIKIVGSEIDIDISSETKFFAAIQGTTFEITDSSVRINGISKGGGQGVALYGKSNMILTNNRIEIFLEKEIESMYNMVALNNASYGSSIWINGGSGILDTTKATKGISSTYSPYNNADTPTVFSENFKDSKLSSWSSTGNKLTYDVNGALGIGPTDGNVYKSGDKVTVPGKGSLNSSGLTFVGWNTMPDGCGTNYEAGSEITVERNTTLYANFVAHVHTAGSAWNSDENYHWKDATCHPGQKVNTALHTYGSFSETKKATCTEAGAQQRECTVCGYKDTQAVPAIGHELAATWTSNGIGHWHACANDSSEKPDFAAHTYGADDVCTVCLYLRVKVTVTVEGGSFGESGTSIIVDKDGNVTVTADTIEGKKFKHWADGDGNVWSTESTYTFAATANISIKAVFEDIKNGLSVGAVIGISAGAVLLILLAAYVALFFVWKKKNASPVKFLTGTFRRLSKLIFGTELNDAETEAAKTSAKV